MRSRRLFAVILIVVALPLTAGPTCPGPLRLTIGGNDGGPDDGGDTGGGDADTPDGGDDGDEGVGDGGDGGDDGELPAAESLTLFDEVWTTFDRTYAYFNAKGINWTAVGQRHRPDFARPMTGDAFAAELAEMLSELHDWQVTVQQPGGAFVPVVDEVIADNYPPVPFDRYAPDGYETIGNGAGYHARLTGNIGYIRIDALTAAALGDFDEEDIGQLVDTYRDTVGLIVDLRATTGDDTTLPGALASHFVDASVVFGYTETRNGPGHGDFDPWVTRRVHPAAGTLYPNAVVCLTGQRCANAGEWSVLMMRSAGAILLGATTRGSAGNPQHFTLANGVIHGVSTWIAYTDDRIGIEDRGIDPALFMSPAASVDATRDYVVEEAMSILVP